MTRLVLCAVALATLVVSASAYTFDINQYWPLYTHEDYRPVPSWRIGIWDKDSVPAKASPKKLDPHVTVDLKILDYGGRSAQFYIYPIHRVERDLYENVKGAHPCMDVGQEFGVADAEKIRSIGGAIIEANPTYVDLPELGYKGEVLEISARADVKTTGFFAFTVLFCRYAWVEAKNKETGPYYVAKPVNADGDWIRVLDVGSNKTRVVGTVKVVNPYGEAPGQAYGFVPFYAIFFVVMLLLMVVLGIGMGCAGSAKIVLYHWCIIGAVALSLWASIFYLAYIGEVNERDVDKAGIYIAGYLFMRLRDGFARICMLMIFGGLGILRGKLENREIVMTIVYGVVYFVIGIIKVIATETQGQRVIGLSAVTRMHPGPREWGTIVIDFLLNLTAVIGCVYYIKVTLAKIEKGSPRRTLYIGTVVVWVFYCLIGFLFGIATIADSQFHERVSEDNWKGWWFEASFMDMLFGICLIIIVIIWFPRERTLNLLGGRYTDDGKYGDIQREAAAPGAAEGAYPGAAGTQPGAAAAAPNNARNTHVDYGDQEMHHRPQQYGGGPSYAGGGGSPGYAGGGGSVYGGGGGGSGLYGGGGGANTAYTGRTQTYSAGAGAY